MAKFTEIIRIYQHGEIYRGRYIPILELERYTRDGDTTRTITKIEIRGKRKITAYKWVTVIGLQDGYYNPGRMQDITTKEAQAFEHELYAEIPQAKEKYGHAADMTYYFEIPVDHKWIDLY